VIITDAEIHTLLEVARRAGLAKAVDACSVALGTGHPSWVDVALAREWCERHSQDVMLAAAVCVLRGGETPAWSPLEY
jgi:hypothetical protein